MWPMGLSRHIPDLGWLPWGKPRLYKQKRQFLIAFMRINFFRSQRSSVFTLLSYLNRLLLRISLCNSLFQIRTFFLDLGVTYLDWKRSSGWLESWEGLLLGKLTLRQPVPILKMASAQVVETSVDNNSPSQDSIHPDDLFQSNKAEVCGANAQNLNVLSLLLWQTDAYQLVNVYTLT